MPFKPGKSGNPAGRPQGKKNAITKKAKLFITDFLERDQGQAEEDWLKLKPYERWNIRSRLLEYVTPKMQRSEMNIDVSKLSDEEVDTLLERAVQKLQGHD